ncbi:hypothetical protein TNCV_2827911 [Trichonephila clavipes]|nr:hypothetical protein TNCV_2827911 [Trichonephila clavipes]
MPTHSNLGVKSREQVTLTRQALQSWCVKAEGDSIAQIGRISPWCTRKCHSPYAPHRADGQAGCGHSNPGNGAAFPG